MLMRGDVQEFLRMADGRRGLYSYFWWVNYQNVSIAALQMFICLLNLTLIVLQIYVKKQEDKEMITAMLIIAVIIKEISIRES